MTGDLRFGKRVRRERARFFFVDRRDVGAVRRQAGKLAKLQRERDEYKKLYTHLREENERLKRGLLGKKAEKLPQNDAQLSLAILGLMLGGGEEPI